jgi:hypothetical protein
MGHPTIYQPSKCLSPCFHLPVTYPLEDAIMTEG